MSEEFTDRVALVTGAARGIGRAAALQLAREGARVAVNYRASREQAEETLDQIKIAGGQGMLVQADISQPADVQRMVAEVTANWGPVELLVNNAGIFDVVPHEDLTLDRWQRTFDVNVTGTYLVTWAVKPSMIAAGYGRIVNVASIAGLRPRPQAIAYAASKAAVISLTQSLATVLARHNIRVNAIAPGLIDTEMIQPVDQPRIQELIDATPISRLGTAEEMAELICFLLSERARFTTGQTYVASGGRVLLP